MMIRREYTTFGMCSGLGGGAKGFTKAASRVGNMVATWRCLGGLDVDLAAARDFEKLVGVPCTVMDLFTRAMYVPRLATRGRHLAPPFHNAGTGRAAVADRARGISGTGRSERSGQARAHWQRCAAGRRPRDRRGDGHHAAAG